MTDLLFLKPAPITVNCDPPDDDLEAVTPELAPPYLEPTTCLD